MGVVDILIEDARQEGIKHGLRLVTEQGLTKKSIQLIEDLITELPDWSNEKIANLSATTLEVVVVIRKRMNKKP